MGEFEKIDWVWDFLCKYWKTLFDQEYEIPDIETDSSEDEEDQTNDYDN